MRASSWTKSEIQTAFASCLTLREMITQLENEMSIQGEVICEIRVNDMVLSEDDELKFAASLVTDVDSLVVQSNRPMDLVIGALQSAAGLVPQLEKSALTTAELLRAGEAIRAAEGFKETVSGCQWLVETLMHVRGASDGMGQPLTHLEKWIASEKLIGRVVNDVSEAHGRADSILVADLLEYEMTVALSSWKSTIESELAKNNSTDVQAHV